MIISFDDTHTHTTEVKIVRVPQGVDLGKLRDVHEIYKLVVHDLIGVDEAMSRLDAVVTRKHKYNRWVRVVTYGLAAVCVAPFAFQGRWIDMPIAFGKEPSPPPPSPNERHCCFLDGSCYLLHKHVLTRLSHGLYRGPDAAYHGTLQRALRQCV